MLALDGAVREGNDRKKRAARSGLKYLFAATPVDTTKALSNWLVGIGSPQDVEVDPRGETRAVSAADAYAEANRILPHAKAGETVFVTNAASYIGRLNDGSSAQAPPGFIEAAAMIAEEELKKPSGKGRT